MANDVGTWIGFSGLKGDGVLVVEETQAVEDELRTNDRFAVFKNKSDEPVFVAVGKVAYFRETKLRFDSFVN